MARRASLSRALKDVAIKLAREAERYVGEGDATMCKCGHERSKHCGCGSVCVPGVTCECEGFTPAEAAQD